MDLPDFDIVLNHGDLPLLRTMSQGLLTVESIVKQLLASHSHRAYSGIEDGDSCMALRGKSMRNPLSTGPWTKRCFAKLLKVTEGLKTRGSVRIKDNARSFRGLRALLVRPGPLLLSSASVRQKISGTYYSPMLGPQLQSVCTDFRLASSSA